MKKFQLIIGAVIICAVSPLYAQLQYNELPGFLKANSVWTMGEYGGYDFNTGTPFLSQMYSFEQCASVADSATGQLLFYASGDMGSITEDVGTCWTSTHQLMPNGNFLKGATNSGTTAQGYTIVPMIGSPEKYYLFSLNYQGRRPGLHYSVVDMNLNGGAGDIDPNQKNIVLDSTQLSEAMVVVPGNRCDVWLIVHAFEAPEFKAYRIHAGGIDTPVISIEGELGLNPFRDGAQYSMCNMAISPDRTKLALTHNYTTIFSGGLTYNRRHTSGTHLYRFDPWTGIVSDYLRIHSKGIGYGVAFSPDNSKLYVWSRDFGWSASTDGTVRQYDVSSYDSATIAASAFDLTQPFSGRNRALTSLRLYNGKIYVGVNGTGQLDVINQPNNAGAAADYQMNAVVLHPGQWVRSGLPTEVVYPYHDTFYYPAKDTLICTEWDSLTLEAPEGYDTYIWSDGYAGRTRVVVDYGSWWVKSSGCHTRVDSFVIRGARVPFSLGNDTTLCNVPAPVLTPNKPGMAHRWQDGSTAESYLVRGNVNTYWVEVSQNGCSFSDTVQIHFADLRQDFGYDDQLLCQKDQINLTLQANAPEGAAILWQDGSTGTTYPVYDTGTYWVEVRDSFCVASDTLHIVREFCDCFIELPNAFTPNGDGRNDIWKPVVELGCPVKEYTLRVYNRFGQQVFISVDATRGWDGTINGAPADIGTYMFELWFKGGKNTEVFRKGDITLVR